MQDSLVILIECKLTQTNRAWPQMRELYKPILELVYEKPVVCIQACRNVRDPDSNIVAHINRAKDGDTWHYVT